MSCGPPRAEAAARAVLTDCIFPTAVGEQHAKNHIAPQIETGRPERRPAIAHAVFYRLINPLEIIDVERIIGISAQDQSKYNELNKQTLNCLCTFAIASQAEEKGEKINWMRFPKIAIYRAFQKVYVAFDTRETFLEEMRQTGGLKKNIYEETTLKIIAENTSYEFSKFIQDCLGTTEYEIYKAASKIATHIELLEHKAVISFDTYTEKHDNVLAELRQYEQISGVKEMKEKNNWFDIIQKVSTLRNHARWCELAYTVQCSVLGHLFDTACFSYLMSLEKYGDEELATRHFFMGLFHDKSETWTGDIPSSIKDRIPGFREVTEKYEAKVIEENLYAKLSDFMVKKVKEVMFEDPENAEHFSLIKGADYLAADLECYKMYVSGSKDPYFLGAIKRRLTGIQEKKVELTPICMKLHQYFMKKSEELVFNHLEYVELQKVCIELYKVYAFGEDTTQLEPLREKLKEELKVFELEEWENVEEVLLMFFGNKEILEEIVGEEVI